MTPQYLRALQAAIQAEPKCAPYMHTNDMPKIGSVEAHAKDSAIATILRDKGWGAIAVEVKASRAKLHLIQRGKWPKVVATAAAVDKEHPERGWAQALIHLTEDTNWTVDFGAAGYADMWAGLVASGAVTTEERDEIIGWCKGPSPVTAAEVGRAMRGPYGDEV